MFRFKYSRLALATAGSFVLLGVVFAALAASRLCVIGICVHPTLGWALPLATGVALGALALLLIDGQHGDEPHDAVSRQSACPACGRTLGEDWRMCPYCGAVRTCEVQLTTGGSASG